MLNYISIFCPELQNLLKPICDLIRKGRQFILGEEQQTAFEEIKCRLIKPTALHLPDSKCRFHLYSDTSKFATGSALYHIQNGKPKLTAYVSKRFPETASLAINIVSFNHLLHKVDFDTIVDHLALVHIIKSKAEPTTTRIKRLLELVRLYSFNLSYIKGKGRILSGFSSRQKHDDSNPHDIIPISFNIQGQYPFSQFLLCNSKVIQALI